MKKILIGLLALGSLSVFASEHKICGKVQLIKSTSQGETSFNIQVRDNELIAGRETNFKDLTSSDLQIVTAAKISNTEVCVNYSLGYVLETTSREIVLK